MNQSHDAEDRHWQRPIYELEVLERRYFLNAGFPDPNFADGGLLIDNRIHPEFEAAIQVLVQRDGKILVGGDEKEGRVFIARYNADGTLDESFCSGGLLSTSDLWWFGAMRLQDDGKIVVAGGGGLERFNPDGSIDQGFANSGRIITRPSEGFSEILIQGNGKILVAGDDSITRLNSDGTPDLSFGSSGAVSIAADELRPLGNGFVALVEEDGIPDCVDWCYAPPSYYLLRFDQHGNPDLAFGDNGSAD